MDRKYIAFISYRHAALDSAAAKRLHSLIEQYTIPRALRRNGRKKLGLVFRDREELPVSSDLAEEIRTALDNSEFLIVVCTPNTPQSPWVAREIDYFLQHHERKNVLTVLAEGEPAEAFPGSLTQRVDPASGQVQNIEPLAVDVRADSHYAVLRRLRREINRLVAVMLGCPYDALVLREQKRQRRRVIAIASAVTAIALCFSSLLILKNREIDGKNEELLHINQTLDEKNEELLQVNEELSQTNEALDRQNRAVLLRESQLLAADAQAALDGGDRFAALSSAVAALPRSGVDRPYYAPAESVLMEAMNVFTPQEPCALVSDIHFRQMTPIMDYTMTSDGEKLLTLDQYGVVCCYDSSDASVIWQGDMGLSTVMITPGFFLLSENYGRALCCANDCLVCFDLESGEALWHFRSQDNIRLYRNQFFLSPDGETLCFVYAQYTYGEDAEYRLAVASPDTGEILQTVPIIYTEYKNMYNFEFENVNDYGLGAFSSDGSLFVGAYLEDFEHDPDDYGDDTYTLRFFCADLVSGSSETVYSVDLGNDIYDFSIADMGLSGDDKNLYIIRTLSPEKATVYVECIDLYSKQLVWQRQLPDDARQLFLRLTGSVHSIISDSRIIIGWRDVMHALDPKTGETKSQVSLIANLTGLFPISDFFFSFVLDDGYYAVGWLNNAGLHDSEALGLSLNFGKCQSSEVWNGGLMQGVIVDGYIEEFRLDAGGSAAVIPADDNCCVILKRGTLLPSPIPCRTAEQNYDLSFSGCKVDDLGDKVIVGVMDKWSEDYSWFTDVCLVLDAETGSLIKEVPLNGYEYNTDLWFLPDTSAYLLCSPNGDITLWDIASQQSRQLSTQEDAFIEIDGSKYWTYDIFRSASTRLTSDNSILTALCDTDVLRLWINGEHHADIPLPAQLCASEANLRYLERKLYVSPMGYVLMSHYDYSTGCLMENMHIYDTNTGSWVSLSGDAMYEDSALPAMSSEGSGLAIADTDGNVQIFDAVSGDRLALLELHLPSGSISQMLLTMDDSCLIIYTEDKQLLIYDIATGSLVFRAQMYENLYGEVEAFYDRENLRLYIVENSMSSDNSLCIDTRSWTELSRFSGLMAYLPERDELLLYSYKEPLRFISIPSTAELADMAAEMLVGS